MNKLEKAISLTMSDEVYVNNMYGRSDPITSMEEISKMQDTVFLTEAELAQKKIIFQGSNQDKLVNQLRDIRTALNQHKSKNVIMVVSVSESSGTSFFAKNLAAVTAFDSSRSSLLVDCNIEKPSVAKSFGLNDKKGLLDYIFDKELCESDIIQSIGISRYRCITTGLIESGDEEFFTHPRFKSLLKTLKERYQDRSIFLDAPALLTSANARILLSMCDQVILVAPVGKVSARKLETASKMIPKEKLSGLVINDYVA
jgi:protein-tyrosine kinase